MKINKNKINNSVQIKAKTIGLDLVSVKPIEPKIIPAKSKKQQLKEDRINKLRKINGKDPNVKLPNDIEIIDWTHKINI